MRANDLKPGQIGRTKYCGRLVMRMSSDPKSLRVLVRRDEWYDYDAEVERLVPESEVSDALRWYSDAQSLLEREKAKVAELTAKLAAVESGVRSFVEDTGYEKWRDAADSVWVEYQDKWHLGTMPFVRLAALVNPLPEPAEPEPPAKPDCDVINEVRRERQRQIEVEGWTAEHDDQHSEGELFRAAACYAFGPDLIYYCKNGPRYYAWPWDCAWDKRNKHPRRRQLVIAAALCVAEIERLDRLEQRRECQPLPAKPDCLKGVPAVLCRWHVSSPKSETRYWASGKPDANGYLPVVFQHHDHGSEWKVRDIRYLTPIHHDPGAEELREQIEAARGGDA